MKAKLVTRRAAASCSSTKLVYSHRPSRRSSLTSLLHCRSDEKTSFSWQTSTVDNTTCP
jgi:hypothetical protein